MIETVLLILTAYLIGSIPVGYIIARYYGIDIRARGSGTIGATNVARILGKHYFFLIFALDAGKAYSYLWLIQPWLTPEVFAGCAVALVLGNTRSLFLHFRGGKGIATLAGIMLYVLPPFIWIIFLSVWLVLLISTSIVGIASVGALISTMVSLVFYTPLNSLVVTVLLLLSVWCIYLHRQHIIHYLHT